MQLPYKDRGGKAGLLGQRLATMWFVQKTLKLDEQAASISTGVQPDWGCLSWALAETLV